MNPQVAQLFRIAVVIAAVIALVGVLLAIGSAAVGFLVSNAWLVVLGAVIFFAVKSFKGKKLEDLAQDFNFGKTTHAAPTADTTTTTTTVPADDTAATTTTTTTDSTDTR